MKHFRYFLIILLFFFITEYFRWVHERQVIEARKTTSFVTIISIYLWIELLLAFPAMFCYTICSFKLIHVILWPLKRVYLMSFGEDDDFKVLTCFQVSYYKSDKTKDATWILDLSSWYRVLRLINIYSLSCLSLTIIALILQFYLFKMSIIVQIHT